MRTSWIALCALLLSTTAQAFGAMGHRLIGELAERRLNADAARQVRQLLDGQTLAQIAPWADEIRDQRRDTAPWHYMNFSTADCRYQAQVDCPKGNCLVPVLQAQIQLLANRRNSAQVRGEALRFVVHFMGDLHQPLHLGMASDKGGNDFQIAFDRRIAASPQAVEGDRQSAARQRWWQNRVKGYNLHSLWDTQLLESAALRESDHLQRLLALPAPAERALRTGIPAIAEQSCRIMRSEGFYPSSHRIGRTYVERQRPVADTQLRLAGERLAVLLNRVLGDN